MRVATRVDKLALTPDAWVRYITNRVGFTKGSASKWSATEHEIQERLGVYTFKVKGLQGTYKDYELQAIPPNSESIQNSEREKEQKTQRVERRIRREGIEPRAPSPRRLRPSKK